MKKVFSLFIMLIWVLQFSLPYLLYRWERHQAYHWAGSIHFKADKKSAEFVFRVQSISDVDWEEQGKEFIRNGSIYDVKYIQMKADCILIHAFKDHRENEIIASYHASQSQEKKKHSTWMMKWMQIKCISNLVDQKVWLNPNECRDENPDLDAKLHAGHRNFQFQPPRKVNV